MWKLFPGYLLLFPGVSFHLSFEDPGSGNCSDIHTITDKEDDILGDICVEFGSLQCLLDAGSSYCVPVFGSLIVNMKTGIEWFKGIL